MAESSAAVCAAGDAFVSFASGAAYLPGILCLQRALAQAHAPRVPCPLVIVLDDRPAHALDHASLGRLESSLTPPNRIVNLTSLFARLNGTRRALYALKSGAIPAGSHRAMCGNESRARGAPMSIESCPSWSLARALAHDRALISSSTNSSSTAAKRAPAKVLDVKRPDGQEYLRSWLKVWLWALPDIKRAVYLDGDMLIQRPLDALFDRHTIRLRRANAPGGTMAAVRASCPGQLSFNSGLFVFEPSLTHAVGLTRGAHDTFLKMKTSRYRPFKACELSVGDQSVLNQYFAPRTRYVWSELPQTYNVLTRFPGAPGGPAWERWMRRLRNASVIHLAGEGKPWVSSSQVRASAGGQLWMQSVCGSLVSGPAAES